MLISGIVLWWAAHLFPSLAAPAREAVVGRIGLWPYKGLFSLCIISALVLIVGGWRATVPEYLYLPPPGLRMVTVLLMLPAAVLFISARFPTDLKRILRHPQLSGVLLWAVAHLLANGEQRSVLLFGGLGLWAVVEMALISRREGAWRKPAAVGLGRSLLPVLVGVVLWLGLAFAHPWLAGVAVMPGH